MMRLFVKIATIFNWEMIKTSVLKVMRASRKIWKSSPLVLIHELLPRGTQK
jgi:hypothetical protein